MESYAQQADPVNASSGVLWSGNSIVDCSAQDSNGNNCCAANINTNYKIAPVNDRTGNPPAPWTQNTFPNMCRQFLGAFMSYQNENSTKFPKYDNSGGNYPTNWVYNPIGVTISAAPPGCCAYAETYATPQICGNADTVSGVLDVLRSSNIQLCYWSGSFGNIHSRNVAVGGTQTFQQSCRPLTLEEQFIIAGDYKGGCYDWSARRQDILAASTYLTCPRYGASVTSSYTSPMSRYNSKSTFPYQPLDVECCAGMGTDCPATACFENPYCMDLLYAYCSGDIRTHTDPAAPAICNAWQAFGRAQTAANAKGRYNSTADVASRVPLDYCRSVNFTDIDCAGLQALEGFLYDRLTPNLSVNSVTTVNSLTTLVQVQNASGRSVSNVNVILLPAIGNIPLINVVPPTISFDPWGIQTLTLTYDDRNAVYKTYSYSASNNVVIAGINVTPSNVCSMSTPGEISNPRAPLSTEYPLVNQCADGDYLDSEASTSNYVSTTVPFDSTQCIQAYSNYNRCTNCLGPGAFCYVHNCDGGLQPIQKYNHECKDSSQVGCPFCYIPEDVNNSRTNRYIMPKADNKGLPPYLSNPYVDTNRDSAAWQPPLPKVQGSGCGCYNCDNFLFEQWCGDKGNDINKTRRGLCSPQELYGYDLSFTRTCAGVDATITVLFSTRTDLDSADFPVMGGFVGSYEASGLGMDATSYHVAVYPYTSFS